MVARGGLSDGYSCVIHQWNRKSVQINIFDGASSTYGAERPYWPFSKMAANVTVLWLQLENYCSKYTKSSTIFVQHADTYNLVY